MLRDELIARLRPSEKNQPFYDGKQTGLVLRITPADTRTWYAVARPKGASDPKWVMLGVWPEMKVRATGHAFQTEARDGDSPRCFLDHGNGHSQTIFSHVECDAPDIGQVIFVD